MRSSSPGLSPRVRSAGLVVVLATTLTLAGCGGSGGGSSSGPGRPAATQTTSQGKTLAAVWPLTGLKVKSTTPTHPPVIVKMDNTYASQPQVGLNKADLVTEELVEGGLTRLAVFFDSRIPSLVGPVRSMRASDIGIVKPVHGVVVTSGAARPTISRLRNARVRFESNDAGAKGFYRDVARRAPYNLLMRLKELVGSLTVPRATKPFLSWGKDADFPGTRPATRITARFGTGHTTQWVYRGSTYTNTNSNAAPDGQFRPDTVIVVRVDLRDAGYTDPAGNYVPESVTTGDGKGFVFHGGKVLGVSWAKAGPTKIWRFTDNKTGKAVKIPAGHTWIEVMPIDAKGGRLGFGS